MGSIGSKPIQIIKVFMIIQPGTWVNEYVRSQSDAIHRKDPNSLRTRMAL
jgi:hypothetical protein